MIEFMLTNFSNSNKLDDLNILFAVDTPICIFVYFAYR